MMKTILQGNVCSCGGVWFSVALPESEPSYCPFCVKKIEQQELYNEKKETHTKEQLDSFPDEIKQNLKKANGQEKVKLITKRCSFCTNEVFFDENDAHKADNCPYCAGDLMNVNEEPMLDELKEALMHITDLNELTGKIVSVRVKSINPFKKPKVCEFMGVDQLSLLVKLKDFNTGFITWISLNDIKSIMEVEYETDQESQEN